MNIIFHDRLGWCLTIGFGHLSSNYIYTINHRIQRLLLANLLIVHMNSNQPSGKPQR